MSLALMDRRPQELAPSSHFWLEILLPGPAEAGDTAQDSFQVYRSESSFLPKFVTVSLENKETDWGHNHCLECAINSGKGPSELLRFILGLHFHNSMDSLLSWPVSVVCLGLGVSQGAPLGDLLLAPARPIKKAVSLLNARNRNR